MLIEVFSKSACPQCDTAKSLLKSRGLEFTEIKLDNDQERQAFYVKCGPSVRQMPQIFIDGVRIGGVTGLQAALKEMGK